MGILNAKAGSPACLIFTQNPRLTYVQAFGIERQRRGLRVWAACIISGGTAPQRNMADDFIDLTDAAAAKIREQLPPENAGGALRLAAQRLGNGDFHYAMGFDDERREGDRREEVRGVPVVVGRESLPLVRGLTVDFVELEPGRARFIFLNPNDPAHVPPGAEPG